MIKHLDGVCHVYIDDSADPKWRCASGQRQTQRYGTCNTMETLWWRSNRRQVCRRFFDLPEKGRGDAGDAASLKYLKGKKGTERTTTPSGSAGGLVRVVKGLDEAIEHIAKYGSPAHRRHRGAGPGARRALSAQVDSSSVMWNASTRFADGYEYVPRAENRQSPLTSCTRAGR